MYYKLHYIYIYAFSRHLSKATYFYSGYTFLFYQYYSLQGIDNASKYFYNTLYIK